jgi:hypothetical protein
MTNDALIALALFGILSPSARILLPALFMTA